MSHYSVYVITPPRENLPDEDRINEILAPWWELDLAPEEAAADPRSEFEIFVTDENLEAEYQKWFEEMLSMGQAKPDDDFYGDYSTREKILERYPTAESWPNKWGSYVHNEERGAWGYWHNPIKKWDWFEIGGRYSDRIYMKKNSVQSIAGIDKIGNQARIKDIDWDAMREARLKEAAKWWDEAHKKCEDDAHRHFMYNMKKGQTREEYIKDWATGAMSPFAIVHDGKWHEKGEMGWWAIVIDEKDSAEWKLEGESIIKGLTPEHGITVVDCHI